MTYNRKKRKTPFEKNEYFRLTALTICKECEKTYEFKCPCGGTANAIRHLEYSNVEAWCNKCRKKINIYPR